MLISIADGCLSEALAEIARTEEWEACEKMQWCATMATDTREGQRGERDLIEGDANLTAHINPVLLCDLLTCNVLLCFAALSVWY